MIFARMNYPDDYASFHRELERHLRTCFRSVESGIQGDSWFWVHDGDEKVAVDTFSAMKHEIKSNSAGPHVQRVIEALQGKYTVQVLPRPELEAHEDQDASHGEA